MDREAAFIRGGRLLLIHLAKVEEGLAPLNICMGVIIQHSSNYCRNAKSKMGNNLERKKRQEKQSCDNESKRKIRGNCEERDADK